jgi:hypothetical protein
VVTERFKYKENIRLANEVKRMPYQVTFNKAGGGRGRGRTSTAYRLKPDAQRYADQLNYRLKPDAQRYADQLNTQTRNRNARVVVAKKGTYDRMK